MLASVNIKKLSGSVPHFGIHEQIVNKDECTSVWISGLWMIKTLGSVLHFRMQIHKWILNKDEHTSSVPHFGMDKRIINKDERSVPHFRMQIHEWIVNKDEWINRIWIIKNFRFALSSASELYMIITISLRFSPFFNS
ncbi:hypothetical protein C1645_802594 [Glomus cerebriforme]|uniref:Uncharacterized protein n=1 Tax=Glomus cerebriforme TaxID=658196 RepID=A0A397TD18_9GLOM|nr:hypothetical protein C1645_802594 [Glomus cerebriforme]